MRVYLVNLLCATHCKHFDAIQVTLPKFTLPLGDICYNVSLYIRELNLIYLFPYLINNTLLLYIG